MEYTGTVVEESLRDNRFINNLNVIGMKISEADNPKDRWHLYKVLINEDQIPALAAELKPEHWYMHFWQDDTVIVVFPGKIFRLKHSDQSTWQEAVAYGQSIGIPTNQLDFIID